MMTCRGGRVSSGEPVARWCVARMKRPASPDVTGHTERGAVQLRIRTPRTRRRIIPRREETPDEPRTIASRQSSGSDRLALTMAERKEWRRRTSHRVCRIPRFVHASYFPFACVFLQSRPREGRRHAVAPPPPPSPRNAMSAESRRRGLINFAG